MIDFENKTDNNINIEKCQKIADYLKCDFVELILTDSIEIKNLNKKYRNINKATDVLSFPLKKLPHSSIGSIVVNIDKVIEKSKEFSHAKEDELALLFLHGLLHLLGYDHEQDNGEMRKKEEEIIKNLSLPNSLIVRNS